MTDTRLKNIRRSGVVWRWCGQSTELNESKPTSNFPNIMRAANDDDDGDSDIGCDDGDEADTFRIAYSRIAYW